MVRYLHCLICVVVQTLCCSATTVAVYRSPSRIIVAADTLFLHGTDRGWERLQICKIKKGKRTYVAAAGVVQNAATSYDVLQLAQSAASHSHTIDGAAKSFEGRGRRAFERTVRWYLQNSKQFYQAEIKRGPEPLQVIFFGIEKGIPRFDLVVFTVSEPNGKATVQSHLETCPGTKCPTGESITVLGENVEAERVASNRYFIIQLKEDAPRAVRSLVEAEATTVPTRVAPPFDVLTISPTGEQWNEAGKCGDK